MIWPMATGKNDMSQDPIPVGAVAVHRWSAALDALESDLERFRVLAHDPRAAVVRSGPPAPEVRPWRPPTDLGPLPVQLMDRAARLLDAQSRDITTAEAARADLGARIAAPPPVAPAPPALYLDVTG